MGEITGTLRDARQALARESSTDAAISSCADSVLLDAVGIAAALVREVQVVQSRLAAEVARRSRADLGHAGLASRRGAANAIVLIATATRGSRAEAAQQIRVGEMISACAASDLRAGDSPTPSQPGEAGGGVATQAEDTRETSTAALSPLAVAVLDGRIGLEAADRITRTLEPVLDRVDPVLLHQAVQILGVEAATRAVDDLATMARGVRDTLDRIGVADRELSLRAQRGLRRGRVIDGLRRVTLVLDPESDSIILGAIDHAMSPRLGGPRFMDSNDVDRARRLIDDDRTNEQIALDVLTDLVRAGVDRDDGAILGSVKPGVRVVIPLADLIAGVDESGEHPDGEAGRLGGPAWLEGHPEPLSAATARRLLCEAGALPVVLGGRHLPLDVGATRRLFTSAQRVALAIRDGGCRFPDCDRPPSWCEAHHIDPWKPRRPGGRHGPSDLANGVLLCRRHHMILHDHGWNIRRGAAPGDFSLIPPASVDAEQSALPMPSKSPPWLRTG